MVYPNTANVWDSDAYGVDTDGPEDPYETINDGLRLKDEHNISDAIKDFVKEVADEYFDTSEWDDSWWDAWEDKFRELM